MLTCSHWCEVIPGTHFGDFLGWTSRDFPPHATKHITCLECHRHPFMAGSVTATWASQIHNVKSFKYFSAFLDKICDENENPFVALEKVQLLPKWSRKQRIWSFGLVSWEHLQLCGICWNSSKRCFKEEFLFHLPAPLSLLFKTTSRAAFCC